MDELTTFLQQQKIMQIAPRAGAPWIANVLMVCAEPTTLYFIGSEKTRYGQLLTEDPTLAFATAWHHADSHIDRKGIQAIGEARPATEAAAIETAVTLHNRDYPEFSEKYTVEWIMNNEYSCHVWVITPRSIKFWNDELYGRDGSKEFNF